MGLLLATLLLKGSTVHWWTGNEEKTKKSTKINFKILYYHLLTHLNYKAL